MDFEAALLDQQKGKEFSSRLVGIVILCQIIFIPFCKSVPKLEGASTQNSSLKKVANSTKCQYRIQLH